VARSSGGADRDAKIRTEALMTIPLFAAGHFGSNRVIDDAGAEHYFLVRGSVACPVCAWPRSNRTEAARRLDILRYIADWTVYVPLGRSEMGLDIRLPIGLMFTLFGVLLVVYGFVSDKSIYQRSLGINVNIGWGIVLLIFGVVMLVLGHRAAAAKPDESEHGSSKSGH